MNKERVKSIILALLIIFNLMLAEKILVDKKLWPSGYNFFNIRASHKSDYSIIGHLTLPEKIFVNTGYQSSRFEYLRNSEDFTKIYAAANIILQKAFSEPLKNAASVSSDSWYSALTAKSVYLSYPCRFSAQNFASLIGLTSTELSFSGFSDIVISENGNVYIKDDITNSFYRIDISSSEIGAIIGVVSDEYQNEESVINYSFDLNFDKDFGDQKTFLSPMIPIYSAPVAAEVMISQNPIMRDEEINQKTIGGILTAFSINPNTVRRYTEADGSLVFVENNGILKISPQGVLSFTASDTGIKLSGVVSQSTHSNISAIAEFIDKVNAATGIESDMCVISPLISDMEQSFTFDYIANGLPVKFDGQNAVTAKTENGYLAEYTQILRKYIHAGTTEQTPLYIEALDDVIADYQDSMSEISITKMQPAYLDDLSMDEKYPDWFIDIDNVIAQ
ncbi:MAG: hypothetical protein J6C82_08595 [Clostridia bacterium]|nr:hypothetical protein [Clostridia bacterium]